MGITVVGLGPGDGRLVTRQAWEILVSGKLLFLRTARHPVVADLPSDVVWQSFDAIYETAVAFDDVYTQITEHLLATAQEQEIVYAVPGHPFVGESTVTRLIQQAKSASIPVVIVEGLSFVEPTLTAVAWDALDGLQLFDAIDLTQYQYPPINPAMPLLLGQVYSRMLAAELKLLLMSVYPDEHPVQLIHGAGMPDQVVEQLPLYEIDRSEHTAHLTSLFIPALPAGSSLMGLAETVAILRSPNGCPWDQEQTPQSMRTGFLEEASEVLDALDNDDPDGLAEELGDMFYHLVMQTQMAAEEELFRLPDVLAAIDAKLKRRHPHVWGDWEVTDSDHVVRNWEMIKQTEKGDPAVPTSLLASIPQALPALAQSQKIQTKVNQVGFDWDEIGGVYAKLHEELQELQAAQSAQEQAAELGDLLFITVNLARWLKIDAESALREANLKFKRRFQLVEQLAAERNLELAALTMVQLEALWQEAKQHLADTEF